MTAGQRFCPVCDRPFATGEAVLRCNGCQVLHHPGCWVKNQGCATSDPHKSAPIAEGYETEGSAEPGQAAAATPPPGIPRQPPREPVTFTQRVRPVEGGQGTAIGGEPRGGEPQTPPAGGGSKPPPPRPRYVEVPGPGAPAKPMPRVYRPNSILAYWYVPLAAVLAVVVAVGVVWAADQLFGGDGSPAAAGDPQATPDDTQTLPAGQPTTAGAGTPGSGPSPTRAADDSSLRVGDRAVVTGAGDCLNVRVAAGRTNDAIVCLADGQEVTVTGGPVATDGFVWWKVMTFLGEGWAVDEFLVRKP